MVIGKRVSVLAAGASFFLAVGLTTIAWADEGDSADDAAITQTAGSADDAAKGHLSAEQLLQTEAGQLYITRKYEEAAQAFLVLEAQYPGDIKVKRYIGACYFHLKRYDEALAYFNKALEIDANDLPSRQFIAKAYLRQGLLSEAETQLNFMAENDPSGVFGAFAKAQLQSVRQIREAEAKLAEKANGRLTPEQFLKTPAAQAFLNARFEDAAAELKALAEEYPQDTTVRRYIGLSLDRLGRFEEALEAFEEGITIESTNPALHYFKAQTLLHMQRYEEAKAELQYVLDYDTTKVYSQRATADRKAIEQILEVLKRPKPKPWSASLGTGFEPNTNAASESRVTKSTAEEHAIKYANSFSFNYTMFNKGPWTARASYSYSPTLYSELNDTLNTYSHTISETLSHSGSLFEKPLTTQLSISGSHTIVGHKMYSLATTESLTFIYSMLDWWRVTLADRYTFTNYKSDGTQAEYASKDGPGNVLDWNNNFYLNKEKNRFVQLGYEFGYDELRGSNFVKEAHTVKTAYYFPLIKDWQGSLRFKFKRTDYPEYTRPPATATTRFDEDYSSGLSVTVPLPNSWSLTGSYSYTNVQSKDNTYTYINHAGGASLSYSF